MSRKGRTKAGSTNYRGVDGNHIHLPSDPRILNSPEYVLFFWIYLERYGLIVPTVND
ncbi:MAG: hypothetical protein ACOWW1_01685 [archaeon]|nr:hypothetical protein [Candidatus Bathyarchaeum sp.]